MRQCLVQTGGDSEQTLARLCAYTDDDADGADGIAEPSEASNAASAPTPAPFLGDTWGESYERGGAATAQDETTVRAFVVRGEEDWSSADSSADSSRAAAAAAAAAAVADSPGKAAPAGRWRWPDQQQELMAMGFGERAVQACLRETSGDADAALELMLSRT